QDHPPSRGLRCTRAKHVGDLLLRGPGARLGSPGPFTSQRRQGNLPHRSRAVFRRPGRRALKGWLLPRGAYIAWTSVICRVRDVLGSQTRMVIWIALTIGPAANVTMFWPLIVCCCGNPIGMFVAVGAPVAG